MRCLAIDETGSPRAGQGRRPSWRGNTPVRRARSTNCQIGVSSPPMLRDLAAMRSSTARVSSEGLDRRSRSPQSRVRTPRRRLCNQTQACDENDRTRDSCGCPVQVGCRRYGLRCWRHRTAATSGRQRLCTRRQQRSCTFIPGASVDRSPARPPTSPGPDVRPTGNACPQEPEPKDRGCMIGAISNWPISMPGSSTAPMTVSWTRGLLIRRRIADGDLAFFTTWCPAGTTIETLVAVEGHRWAIEDEVPMPPRTSSGSITTRADPGMAGIATFPW